MSFETLVCSCGMRLRAPGAVPGRVGKCPRCGSMLRVPDAPTLPVPPPAKEMGPVVPRVARPTFVKHRARSQDPRSSKTSASDGLVRPPTVAEVRLRDSLTYPLWNASGLSVLVFMSPLMAIATSPLFAIFAAVSSGSPVAILGLIIFIPQFLLLLAAGGYTLLFLGQVLVTSALGEVAQPRSPGWNISDIGQGLGRWAWALVVGGTVGGLPAMVYWINCGDVDLLDRIVLVDLLVPGMAYAQMGLLATLIFETPLAANPVTVARAIYRVGWSYLAPCVLTGSTLVVLAALFGAVLRIKDPFGLMVAYLAFWVALVYAAMVVLRRLGLFCYRHAVILDWFPGRAG